LKEFGSILAQRPIDMENVSKAREIVLSTGGDGLLVEAASIVGAYALMTSVVDATGRKEIPGMGEMTKKMFQKYKK